MKLLYAILIIVILTSCTSGEATKIPDTLKTKDDITSQTITLDRSTTGYATIAIDAQDVSSVSISGTAEGLADITATTDTGEEYLIYRGEYHDKSFTNHCEESCNLASVNIKHIAIYSNDKVYLESITTSSTGNNKLQQKKEQQVIEKLANKLWKAGQTTASQQSYVELRALANTPPQQAVVTNGLEYYQGGMFTYDDTPLESITSNVVLHDLRSYQGNNYVTPVQNQDSCGSCYSFAGIGQLEISAQLQFNKPDLFIDLSEQFIVDCDNHNAGCLGGNPQNTLQFMQRYGVPDEACMPYLAAEGSCENRCLDWQDRSWKIMEWQDVNDLDTSKDYVTIDDLKQAINEHGSIYMTFWPWYHAMHIIGYGELSGTQRYWDVQEGMFLTEPAEGISYFIVKNSWGNLWADNGFFNVVFTRESLAYADFYVITGDVVPPNPIEQRCQNNDNDQYCYWGLGVRPESCNTLGCPQPESDCNDIDEDIGPCPADYYCGSHQELPNGEGVSFGSYEDANSVSCCGDELGEYAIEGYCCFYPYSTIENNHCIRQDIPNIILEDSKIYVSPAGTLSIENLGEADLEITISTSEKFITNTPQITIPARSQGTADFIYQGSHISEFGTAILQTNDPYKPQLTITLEGTQNNALLANWPQTVAKNPSTVLVSNSLGNQPALVVTSEGHNSLNSFTTDGNPVPGFPLGMTGSLATNPKTSAAIGDIDGDGFDEIVVITSHINDYSQLIVGAYTASGSYVPGFPYTIPEHGEFSGVPILANIDQDLALEVIYAHQKQLDVPPWSEVYIDILDQEAQRTSYSTTININLLGAGNFDDDPQEEIILLGWNGLAIIKEGEITSIDSDEGFNHMIITDYNNDGYDDIITNKNYNIIIYYGPAFQSETLVANTEYMSEFIIDGNNIFAVTGYEDATIKELRTQQTVYQAPNDSYLSHQLLTMNGDVIFVEHTPQGTIIKDSRGFMNIATSDQVFDGNPTLANIDDEPTLELIYASTNGEVKIFNLDLMGNGWHYEFGNKRNAMNIAAHHKDPIPPPNIREKPSIYI